MPDEGAEESRCVTDDASIEELKHAIALAEAAGSDALADKLRAALRAIEELREADPGRAH